MKLICPNCLNTSSRWGTEKYCDECGTEFLEWGLCCDCGEPTNPYFPLRIFPPWGRSTTTSRRYCQNCGKDIRGIVKRLMEALRKAYT